MYSKLESLGLALLDPDGTSRAAPGFVAFLVLSALLLGGMLLVGPYPITLFPEDAMHMLVQGDYLVRGYRPYVDYFSMHGPFPFVFSAIGIEAHGVSLRAVLLAQVLGAALFGALMYKIASARLHWFWAVLLAASVELILASCTPMGRKSWREFTPAMWYNAMGFAIVAIVFLYLLLPSRSRRAASHWVDAAVIAFCLAACFHTKMSFFVPLAAVFLVGAIAVPRDRSMRIQASATLVLAGALIVAFMWSLGGSLAGYRTFLGSMSIEVHPLALSLRFVQYTRTIGVFALGLLLAGWAAKEAGLLHEMRREWLLSLLMFGAMLLMVSTCKQDPETLPLVGIIPLGVTVLSAALARRAGRPISLPLATPALIVALLLTTHESKNSALSWIFSQMTLKTIEAPVERLLNAEREAAELVSSDRVDRSLYSMMPRASAEKNLAALSLLKDAGTTPGQVLFVATTANSVTLMTNLKYARGESPWWPFTFSASPTDAPLTDPRLLDDADWLLRDLSDDDAWQYVTHYRGEFVADNFQQTAKNDHWMLYRRMPVASVQRAQRPTSLARSEVPSP